MFDTVEGVELIVPGWQILHAWYLFDAQVIPYVLGGMLDVSHNYGIEMPWLPGTQCHAGHVTYHAPPSLSEYNAKAISRLLFDPVANRSAKMIHQKLMASRTRLPLIWPPHSVPARWTFRTRPLTPREGRERWLLLHLHAADVPLPFNVFELVKELPSQKEVTDVKPVIARTGAPLARDGQSLRLVGTRTGARRVTPSSFPALGFSDYAVETVEVTRRFVSKDPERATGISIVLPNPELELEAASTTTLGSEDKTVLAVRPRSSEKDAEESATLFQRSRSAFQAVIDYVTEQQNPQGYPWGGRFIHSGAEDFFFQESPWKRNFLILEFQIADRYTYLLDVCRKPDDEEFTLAMIRRNGAVALSLEHFHVWLRGFPFAGKEPWGDGVQTPRWLLRPMQILHQTTQLPARFARLPETEQKKSKVEAHYVRLFRDRLIRYVTQYEELKSKESRRVRKLEHRRKLPREKAID
ncbi:hypothetical protein [Xanthomonas sp. MUS 060]|uniref:hypothetical protein n=1 Tax=Xanthomonas sp. MUS 060 TaxID=1588031 RepID=UPI001269FFB1|nr:hypothetical protein [Xanthomonas sp. MUS 060]